MSSSSGVRTPSLAAADPGRRSRHLRHRWDTGGRWRESTRGRALSALVLLLGACAEHAPPRVADEASHARATAPVETRGAAPGDVTTSGANGSAASESASTEPVERHGLVWYEDAPEAAFAAARAAGKRVVVDLWAPWCHTCLSMQSVVMTAENLPEEATRFVWLGVDTERESNASLLERLPVSVWPTFYVVDVTEPSGIEVEGRWLGAASPLQFRRFLNASDRAPTAAKAGAAPSDDLSRGLSEGDDLAARGRHADAARAYAAVLQRAPADWPRRPETLVAEITSLSKAKDIGRCLTVASAGLSQTGIAASSVDFSSYALACAEQVEPVTDAVTRLRRAIAARLEPLCDKGSSELSPDDQADACDKLAEARSALGNAEGARSALVSRLRVLDRAAAGKAAEGALTYDWARTDALLQLGRADEALAIATEREQQLPQNYNPPHYRAKALKALGRWQEGLDALERALGLAYGPRKIGLLTLKADLLFGAGREADAISTLEQQLGAYRALPAGQRQPAAEARVEARLREATAARTAPAAGR